MSHRRLLIACVAFLSAAAGPTLRAQSPPPGPRTDCRALLVGVTFYEHLPKNKHLEGPANDVELMRKLLIEKLQFSPDRIVTLSEQAGAQLGKEFLPTKANIAREFARLATVSKPGEHVVIHLGGHGSQQPEDKTAPDPEPDGLDEIFLPRDAGSWDAKNGSIANAIIDNEISLWLRAIRNTKASIWINFDSCHSGDMIRGGNPAERARDLDPVADLGIPKAAVREAVEFAKKRDAKSGTQTRGGGDVPPPFKLAADSGIVAIYACQPNEVTYERELPPKARDAKIYGLLTYSLCQILTEAADNGSEPITYRELARRIHGQYLAWGKQTPTPLIEGVDRDRRILGDTVWPGRSSIQLAETDDGFTVNAGALHGLTAGSILAVSPPPGKGKTLLGHVRVKEIGVYVSVVEPVAHAGAPLAKDLPTGGTCRTVYVDFGDQQLRVAADPTSSAGKPVPEKELSELRAIVQKLGGPSSLIQPVTATNEADWLVRFRDKGVMLVPGSGWFVPQEPKSLPAFGPVPVDVKLGDWLQSALARIARGESLKRLAASGDPASAKLRLNVDILRKKDKADTLGSIRTGWPTVKLTAYDKDRFAIRLDNAGKAPIDVTALYVDSGYGISCLYPKDGDLNRLRPGDRESFGLTIGADTSGSEYLVFIAVKGGDQQPVDFSFLEQPTLEAAPAGTRGVQFRRSLDTPLGRLLKKGMFGVGGTRGGGVDELEEYAVTIVTFDARPTARPPGKED
jgi:hypothetical protein